MIHVRTTMTRLRQNIAAVASLLVTAMATNPAHAVQISQVADRAPDLAVFLKAGSARPAATAASQNAPTTSVALGSTPLRLKSAVPWDPASGVSMVVALDVSASIGAANFNAVKRDLVALLGSLPARSQVALLAIGTEVRTVQSFGPVAATTAALDTLVPDSPETALYEAVLAAQEMASKAAPSLPLRRVVLVLTDGIDDSRHGFGREEALKKIVEGDAPVFSLALAPARPAVEQREAIKSLAEISRASGGAFVQSTAGNAAGNLNLLLAEALRAQLLTLDCSACARDGVLRTLQVSVQQKDATSSDSRGLRLLASQQPPPAVASAASSGSLVPPQLPIGPHLTLPVRISLTLALLNPWQWALVLAAAVAAIAVGLGLRHSLKKKPETDTIPPGTEIKTDVDPPKSGSDPLDPGAVGIAVIHVGARQKDGLPVMLDVAGQGRMQIRVGASEVVFGRAKKADVSIEHDPESSSRHAALYLLKGALMLRDLGSSNGTYLNGTRIVRPEPIQDRDLVRIGRTEVRVYLGAG